MKKTVVSLWILVIIFVFALVGWVYSPFSQQLGSQVQEKAQVFHDQILTTAPEVVEEEPSAVEEEAKPVLTEEMVSRVIDGDTIELATGQKVRLIGINTPESVDPRRGVECFGKEAAQKTKALVEAKVVRLEKDVSETDRFGRLLRYVYLVSDSNQEVFVNDYLVREGWAQVDTFPPDVKYRDQFLEAQNYARENNLGLWNACK